MATYSRRDFLKTSVALGASVAAGAGGLDALAGEKTNKSPSGGRSKHGGSKKRPNILWIQTDEQRPDSLGCYGSSWAHTPNLDRLARQGVVFDECHVQSPVCVPCRTSMMMCKYPTEMDIYDNDCANKDGYFKGEKGFTNLFADEGYRIASLGKSWHGPAFPIWGKDGYTVFYIYEEAAGFFNLGPGFDEKVHRVVKRPGESHIILGGVYPYYKWGDNPSSQLTDMAIDWLKKAAKSDQPFLLNVGHLWPHTPTLVPRPWDKLYKPGDVPCHALNRKGYMERSKFDRDSADVQRGFDLSMETWRQISADYYGLCSYVDNEVGRLMRALDELGLTENTIVAFNSDHGKDLGEFGQCEKCDYNGWVWKVPFILSWPGHLPEGEHRQDLIELIDFGATLGSAGRSQDASRYAGRGSFQLEATRRGLRYHSIGWGPAGRAVRTKKYRYDCTVRFKRRGCVGPGGYDPIPYRYRGTILWRREISSKIRPWPRPPGTCMK